MDTTETLQGNALADWRIPENYPAVASRAMGEWAWECLRRNADYQRDSALMLQLPIEWQLRIADPIDNSGSRAGEGSSARKQAERTALIMAGLPVESANGVPRGVFNLSPLRVFRSKWCVNFAFAHTLRFSVVNAGREFSSDESRVVAQSNMVQERKNFPALLFHSASALGITNEAVSNFDDTTTIADSPPLAILPAQTFRVGLAPNEALFRFFLNGSMSAQIDQASKWLETQKKKYEVAEAKHAFGRLPSGGAMGTSESLRRRVQPANLHWALRIYDAMVEAGRRADSALDAGVKDAMVKANVFSGSGDFQRSSNQWFYQAKWYVEKGGYLAVAQYEKSVRNKSGDADKKKPEIKVHKLL